MLKLPGKPFMACLAFTLAASSVLAQEDQGPDAPSEGDTSASQETEISEDNYRRYMELKDQQLERAPLPVEAYEQKGGLEKMESLPEASQKHLRNELREIIVQGEAWQPEDAGTLYDFTPSQAAQADSELKGRENEAWRELVGEYHDREAAIHAAARSTQNAGQQGQPQSQNQPGQQGQRQSHNQPGQQGQPQMQNQQGQQGEAGQQASQQAGQQTDGDRREMTVQEKLRLVEQATATATASSQAVPRDAITEEGVTENALQYLTRKCADGEPDDDCPEQAEEDQ